MTILSKTHYQASAATSVDKPLKEYPEVLKFGLSILHARIRFLESLLHMEYEISIWKWQVRSATNKKTVQETKEKIQTEFRQNMRLLLDVPKLGLELLIMVTHHKEFLQIQKRLSQELIWTP